MGVWQAAGSGAGPAGPASLRLPSPGGGGFLPAPGEGGCGLSPEVTICGAGTPGALGALASCREPCSGPGGQRSFANLPLQPACFSPYSPYIVPCLLGGAAPPPPGMLGPAALWFSLRAPSSPVSAPPPLVPCQALSQPLAGSLTHQSVQLARAYSLAPATRGSPQGQTHRDTTRAPAHSGCSVWFLEESGRRVLRSRPLVESGVAVRCRGDQGPGEVTSARSRVRGLLLGRGL